jgi:hypothetical protein
VSRMSGLEPFREAFAGWRRVASGMRNGIDGAPAIECIMRAAILMADAWLNPSLSEEPKSWRLAL